MNNPHSRRQTTPGLGLESYRGRYFWLSLLTGMILIGLALWGQRQARELGDHSTSLAARQSAIINTLIDAEQAAHQLKEFLLAFSLDPQQLAPATLDTLIRRLQLTIERLARQETPELGSGPQVVRALAEDVEILSSASRTLIQVRQHTSSWIPASDLMREQMVPATATIAGLLQHLDSELGTLEPASGLRDRASRLRLHWQHIIGELRLLVANRFGIFDTDAHRAMRARISNIEERLEVFRQRLLELRERLEAEDDAPLIAEVEEIDAALARWTGGYHRLRAMLDGTAWRQDLVILQERIAPVLDRLLGRLLTTRMRLQAEANAQLKHLLRLGDHLATGIGWLAGGIILLLALGYLAFQYWLLRPISEIAEQLHREASGEGGLEVSLPPIEETRHLVEAFSAMREQVRAREQRLDYLAYHDPLTGLPNRRLFQERLANALHDELPKEHQIAILFLDLDRFKQINDSHGHIIGDQLLIQVARRLRSVLRSDDLVARISGDEFAVLLGRFSHRSEPARLAQKVLNTLDHPFEINDIRFHTSASIGISIAPEHGTTADELIQHADTAMYQAKAAGRAGVARFHHEMLRASRRNLQLERDLHQALPDQQMRLFVQPILDIEGHRLHACECLLRWQHPQRGLLAPGTFLALAEEMGLMPRITDWLLDQLEARRNDPTPYSINVSARLLHGPGFLEGLRERIASGRLHGEHLIVEVTEDTLARDLERITQQLADIQARGVRIALDDFGTGQSSLSHLRAFPFDMVKIDRSFVKEVVNKPQDATLVRAIIGLAHTLDMEVVAEGVETPEQHAFLRAEGCDWLQGYLFGRPRLLADTGASPDAAAAPRQARCARAPGTAE